MDILHDPRVSPAAYARSLSRYISDCSTVRARTLDMFGRSPPRGRIEQWRAQWELTQVVDERRDIGEPIDDDAIEFAPRAVCFDKLVARAAGREITPRLRRSGDWLLPVPTSALPQLHVCAIAHSFDLSLEDICGASRKWPIARVRNLAAAVLRARGNSWALVARHTGRSDHVTAISAVQTFFARDYNDPDIGQAWSHFAPANTVRARSYDGLNYLLRGTIRI